MEVVVHELLLTDTCTLFLLHLLSSHSMKLAGLVLLLTTLLPLPKSVLALALVVLLLLVEDELDTADELDDAALHVSYALHEQAPFTTLMLLLVGQQYWPVDTATPLHTLVPVQQL